MFNSINEKLSDKQFFEQAVVMTGDDLEDEE